MNTDDLVRLRTCGAAGEKKRAELVARKGPGKMGINAIRQET
ncbi:MULTISPECIES: hypothetical protein [Lachnospiraceae]|nr:MULTISPECIES: hypothetical protein [Lachnospiraceae]